MIPETEIRFSFIYNKKFNPDFTFKDFTELKTKTLSFTDLVRKHIKKFLS